jgi:hypothetical protein
MECAAAAKMHSILGPHDIIRTVDRPRLKLTQTRSATFVINIALCSPFKQTKTTAYTVLHGVVAALLVSKCLGTHHPLNDFLASVGLYGPAAGFHVPSTYRYRHDGCIYMIASRKENRTRGWVN